MSEYYGPAHRDLQDAFDSRRLADLMEGGIMHGEFAPHEIDFIQSRDMFFLASIDPAGRPTVSYKGGAPGFVRVTGTRSLVFPWFDGNGMFYSAGNIAQNGKVGLLFIDFVTPNRLRVQGEGKLLRDAEAASAFPGAQFVVDVAVESIWVNCPRYIHPHQKIADSKYVPNADGAAPMPGWKRLDVAQDAIRPEEREKVAAAGGVIDMETYAGMVERGEA
ncbi:pyridoxamine 5'-phosphate oxidase family protein [Methylocystis parvus]|uniref:pyridoxamine 5'-phosphate oxidase family protein n=1 Tax=Methylocystis parvus TaxID=134 RepID=UPI003C78FB45